MGLLLDRSLLQDVPQDQNSARCNNVAVISFQYALADTDGLSST
jgi:hypothetical protein